MKNIFSILLTAIFAVSLVGCSGGSAKVGKNATPSEVTTSMWKLIQNGDYAKAVAMTAQGQSLSEEEQMQLAQFAEALYSSVGGVKAVEILEEKIADDGKSATVKMKLTYGDGSSKNNDQKLIMTENGWCPRD
ncbi:MAG: Uncharacterized protein AUK63_602 [bacterium P3]|nr:MAG: Uncharacterized protein AUK63_602 [bacterium P3]KWW42058.1 MAG: Uncharacterized protein F083_709 [bacterium F083]